MKKIILGLFLLVILTLSGCVETPAYTNEVVYECKEGYDYSFPSNEPTFAKLSVSLIDKGRFGENQCVLSLNYKVKFKPTYYEIDVDVCKLTISQLANFKAENADLTTMLRSAACDQKTNLFLPKVSTTPDSSGQATNDLNSSLKAAGLTYESGRALLTQIAQDSPIDKCPKDANQVACLSAAWEYAFRKGIPKGQEVTCELVRAEELKALCKSGVAKSLSAVEQEFNKYVE